MEPSNTQSSSSTRSSTGKLSEDSRSTSTVKDDAKDLKQEAQDNLGEMGEQAKQQASETAARQKRAAAEQASGLANALRKTGDRLNEQDQSFLGHYAHTFASSLDGMAESLNDEDVDSLLGKAQNFARREPGMFFGGAMAAGFVLARFLKSSNNRSNDGAGLSSRSASPIRSSRDSSAYRSHDNSSLDPKTRGNGLNVHAREESRTREAEHHAK